MKFEHKASTNSPGSAIIFQFHRSGQKFHKASRPCIAEHCSHAPEYWNTNYTANNIIASLLQEIAIFKLHNTIHACKCVVCVRARACVCAYVCVSVCVCVCVVCCVHVYYMSLP